MTQLSLPGTSHRPQGQHPESNASSSALKCPEGDLALKKMSTDNIQDSGEKH